MIKPPLEHLKYLGINHRGLLHYNLDAEHLVNLALERGEGELSSTGALTVSTGKYTGRSPNDRFFVDDELTHNSIYWNKSNMPMALEEYKKLFEYVTDYLSELDELYVFDGMVGADPKQAVKVRVINELAFQNLSIRHMLRRPNNQELADYRPEFTMLVAPGCQADLLKHRVNSEVFIVINFKEKIILIGASSYGGEMKKAIFTVMNYLMPQRGVLPMHCSANIGKKGDSALFFGLSGTGKTTLSADPARRLIGDDEHGWSDRGIFNFEGGCYAKCINLTEENEPQIYRAIKYGSVAENVVMHPQTKEYDFRDSSLTENTRVAYPLDYIPSAEISGLGDHPKTIIFLTADAFGVMPPVAKLNREQTMYHFMSGYTSKLAGTERGITEPQATFSSFFGEPFMPLFPMVYANLLRDYIRKYKANIYLINTGWSGGPYGLGERMPIKLTRQIVSSVLRGDLEKARYQRHDIFNLMVPKNIPVIPSKILDPKQTWDDKQAYDKQAKALSKLFKKNFARFKNIPDEVYSAGPV